MSYDHHRTHIMVDLETFGNGPSAAIVQVAAVRFTTDGDILSEFDMSVDLESAGIGQIDASTVKWWLNQSEEARKRIGASYARPIQEVLERFSFWLNQNMASTVWACDPSFDLVILRSAYERQGWQVPIDKLYRKERSCRTIKMVGEMLGVEQDAFEGVAHDALADSVHQAKYVAKVLRTVETLRTVTAGVEKV